MYTGPVPHYPTTIDIPRLIEEWCPPPLYFERVHRMPREALRALQEKRLVETVARAWEIPFFARLWKQKGLAPGDIRSLDDLRHLPLYDVNHIRESIARKPPFGDFMGMDRDSFLPMVIQTSGGTTGLPRPMLYSPHDREIMAMLGARRLTMQGIAPGDIVQCTYSLGLTNGGAMVREALWKYTGAIPLMTGSGNITPSRRQIEIMKAWGSNVILGFPHYLRHLATVARDELKIEPRSLNIKMIGSHLGVEDRTVIEDLWGAPVQDMYGTNECSTIAADCPHKTGLHINEDAFVLEIVDPDTGAAIPDGQRGTIVLTTLFKQYAPQIRFNVNDVSAIAAGPCPCGGTHRRLERIYGRSDNMVKLRGVNVFPEAIGALIGEDRRTNGEYFCIVEHVGADRREDMTVLVEKADASVDAGALAADLERRFKEALGVKVTVKPQSRGELDRYTGGSQTSKLKRLDDRRKKS